MRKDNASIQRRLLKRFANCHRLSRFYLWKTGKELSTTSTITRALLNMASCLKNSTAILMQKSGSSSRNMWWKKFVAHTTVRARDLPGGTHSIETQMAVSAIRIVLELTFRKEENCMLGQMQPVLIIRERISSDFYIEALDVGREYEFWLCRDNYDTKRLVFSLLKKEPFVCETLWGEIGHWDKFFTDIESMEGFCTELLDPSERLKLDSFEIIAA